MKPGDRVRVRTPGGGGYGDPLTRDPALVAEDVRLERYTREEAGTLFGVVIAEGGVPDWQKTEALRTHLRT
jgi:N-methylhydantoinase B